MKNMGWWWRIQCWVAMRQRGFDNGDAWYLSRVCSESEAQEPNANMRRSPQECAKDEAEATWTW